MWIVTYSRKADKQLQKLDPQIERRIIKWINQNLVGCTNPRSQGKSLEGPLSDFWRYRVGNYRLLAELHDEIITIDVIKISHRSSVY